MRSPSETGFLLDLSVKDSNLDRSNYPLCLPIVRGLGSLNFHPNVTFFVGENGSGKSTLIEAIACKLGFNPEGGNKNTLFSTKETHSDLHKYLTLGRSHRTPADGYFLRAESFFNVASYVDEMAWYLNSYGGVPLHQQSHGEAFISLLNHKFRGNGLYLLDEPEAALSPSRQLSALAIMHELVMGGSQFIVATHSPILMSYPNATIYQLGESGVEPIDYTDTEHYQLTKSFLDNPKRILSELFDQ